MSQWLNWGDGHSGSPNSISGTINTYATCTGTAGQTALTTTLSASAGDQILIHQSQGTGAGTWEICKVTSDAGSTLNLSTALVNSYGTGAQAVLIPQYTGGTISGAVTGTAWNGTVGGIIAIMSNGDLTVSGSISINGSNAADFTTDVTWSTATTGGGFRGGISREQINSTGYQGEGTTGAGGQSSSANGNGGGAGGGDAAYNSGGGGGNGTAGSPAVNSDGINGAGGGISGNAELTNMVFGGGGGGTTGTSTVGGVVSGASGGGIVLIFAKNITITGTINLNGGSNTISRSLRGGAGAGGSCLIKTQVATLGTNRITASGGTITPYETGRNPGAGGVGRIRCDYFTSVSGSTTPTLSSAQDLTLNLPSSNFFAFF